MIDLHVHTTASDGQYTPTDIIGMAAEKNIKIIAITDHDTVAGLEEGKKAAEKAGGGKRRAGRRKTAGAAPGRQDRHALSDSGYFSADGHHGAVYLARDQQRGRDQHPRGR